MVLKCLMSLNGVEMLELVLKPLTSGSLHGIETGWAGRCASLVYVVFIHCTRLNHTFCKGETYSFFTHTVWSDRQRAGFVHCPFCYTSVCRFVGILCLHVSVSIPNVNTHTHTHPPKTDPEPPTAHHQLQPVISELFPLRMFYETNQQRRLRLG